MYLRVVCNCKYRKVVFKSCYMYKVFLYEFVLDIIMLVYINNKNGWCKWS